MKSPKLRLALPAAVLVAVAGVFWALRPADRTVVTETAAGPAATVAGAPPPAVASAAHSPDGPPPASGVPSAQILGNPAPANRGPGHPLANWEEYARSDQPFGPSKILRTRLLTKPGASPVRVEEIVTVDADGTETVTLKQAMAAGHVMVGIHNEDEAARVREAAASLNLEIVRSRPTSHVWRIATPELSLNAVPETIQRLRKATGAEIILEPDTLAFPMAVPNDVEYAQYLWHLPKIGAETAWDTSTGDPEVIIAVIDSGLQTTHPDIQKNLWLNPYEASGTPGIDDDGNGFIDDINGWDVVYNDNSIDDALGHGSHVTGIAGADGNNALGVTGVAWDCKVVHVMAYADATGGFYTSDTVEAMDYITDLKNQQNLRIIACNNSYGGPGAASLTRKQAIARMRDANILFVAAAGNEGTDNDATPSYPCSESVADYPNPGDWDNIISVANSNSSDGKSSSSNWGATAVDLAAPGSAIYSFNTYGGYAIKSGTSMAAPVVTGALSLLHSANPHISPQELRQILFDTVDPLSWSSYPTVTNGRLNVAAAMNEVAAQTGVEMIAPADGIFVPLGAPVYIELGSDGYAGTIQNVAFSFVAEDGVETAIATDSNGADGYNAIWSPSATGTYTIKALLTDAVSGAEILRIVQVHCGEIIIDNADGLASVQVTGSWRLVSDSYQSYEGAHLDNPYQNSLGESVRFMPSLLPGSWEVSMFWPGTSHHSNNTVVEIAHDGGTASLVVNQRENDANWTVLGTYTFGTENGQLTVYNSNGGNFTDGYPIADAVRYRMTSAFSGTLVYAVANDPTASETGDTGSFRFVRNDNAGALTVNYSIGGTATAGADYVALPGQVTFADGAYVADVNLTPLDDSLLEGDETILVSVTSGPGYTPAVSAGAIVSLASDEVGGTFQFTTISDSVHESDGVAVFEVERVDGSSGAVSVDWNPVAGSATEADFAGSGTLHWADGESGTKTVAVTIVNDTEQEAIETFTLSLSNPSPGASLGADRTATVKIDRNDEPVPSPDYYSEAYLSAAGTRDFDLHSRRVLFTPDGSGGYTITCHDIDGFLHDTAGASPLVFSDDDDGSVMLDPSFDLPFFGVNYDTIYPNTNGYIKYDGHGTGFPNDITNHFESKQASFFLWDMLVRDGAAYWEELADRVVLTYENFGGTGPDYVINAQIELFADGRIAMSYHDMAENMRPRLAGLSNGQGSTPADFVSSDLSEYGDGSSRLVQITEGGGGLVEGGATRTYEIVLLEAPTDPVTVAISTGNQLSASPAQLTFDSGNWNTPQTVTVTATDDAEDEGGEHRGRILFSLTSGDPAFDGLRPDAITPLITDNDDFTAPGPVTGLQATPSPGEIALAWTNPGDADFAGVLVLAREGSPVEDTPATGVAYTPGATLGDSTVLYVGSNATFTHGSLADGTRWHYQVFAFDARHNYAAGIATSALTPAPEIFVEAGPGIEIVSSGTHDAGTLGTGGSNTYGVVITNLGGLDLTLGNVAIENTQNCAVAINATPDATVPPSASTPLTLGITPSADGPFSFDVSIPTNDGDENPFQWTVTGTATQQPISLGSYRFTDVGNDDSGETRTPNDEGTAHPSLTFGQAGWTGGGIEQVSIDPRGYDNLAIRRWTAAAALDETEYWSFTVQVAAGKTLDVARLEFSLQREHGTYSATDFAVRAFRDDEVMGTLLLTVEDTAPRTVTADFADFAADETQTVEFRFYCWNGDPTKSRSDVLWDDVTLFGRVNDSEVNFAGWATGHGLAGVDAGALADPDGDRLANLLEYALNLHPLQPSSDAAATLSVSGAEGLAFVFRQNPEANDIHFSIDYSTNLTGWEVGYSTNPAEAPDGTISLDATFQQTAPDGTPLRRAVMPLPPGNGAFLRLRITQR